MLDSNSDLYHDLLWVIVGIAIGILVVGLIFEAFRIFFFGSGTVRFSERLGLAHNAGYTAEGDAAAGGKLLFILSADTLLARLSYYNLRPNLRPTILFSRSGKVISAKTYFLKWLGCSLGHRLGHKL